MKPTSNYINIFGEEVGKKMNIREQLMKEVTGDEGQVQYDGRDNLRIQKVTELFTRASVMMIEALAAYVRAADAPVDENSVDIMKGARHDALYSWTTAQGAVSMIANLLRFDGDEALSRAIEASKADVEVDLNGL